MRALLLAAGLGTRLRPITDTVPKCLVEIGGRPLLDRWFDQLFDAGVTRVLVNTHWLADEVRAHIEQSRHKDHVDITNEPELLGTGGTVLENRDWFDGEPFMVVHADNFTTFVARDFIKAHQNRDPDVEITMLAFETDDPQSCGILELDSKNRVIAFHEKVSQPPGNLANAAVYVFEPGLIEVLQEIGQGAIDLSTQVIPKYLGRIQAVRTTGYHRDIGTVESLRQARLDFDAGLI